MVTRTSELPQSATANVRRTTQLPESEENYQYETPIGPERRVVNPDQYSSPIGPEKRIVNPDQYSSEAGPTREDYDAEKKRKFDREQEEWNLKHEQEAKAREYEDEQRKIVESRKLKTFGESASSKVSEKVGNAARAGWGNLKSQLKKPFDVRERNQQKMQGGKQLTKADVERMVREKKGKQTKGQFNQPKYRSWGGGGKVGAFPDIDPFGGMGGGGRGMTLPKAGPNIFNVAGPAPAAPGRQPAQFPPRNPAPKPAMMNFGDPFAGISKGSGKGKVDPFNIGKGVGIGKKSGKKLKKMDDWMDF